MKIGVDYTKCTGLGVCESLAPTYFEVNESGDLVVADPSIAGADLQIVEDAVAACPTEALFIDR